MMRPRLTFLALLVALLASAASVRANLSFSLAPALLPAGGSNEVVFVGSLTNNSLTNLFLNNIQFTFTDAATNYLVGDTNFFFQNLPGIFSSNQTYNDVALGVFISPAAPVGTYSGTASIQGGGDVFGTNALANVSFQVSLTPPTLGVASSPTNLSLTWSVPPGGIIVEQITNLSLVNWSTNTGPVFTNGTTEGVNLTPGSGNLFFRLEAP